MKMQHAEREENCEEPSIDDIINGVVMPLRPSDDDLKTRMQAFASDGDAVFLPPKLSGSFKIHSGESNESPILNNIGLSPLRNTNPVILQTGPLYIEGAYSNTGSPSLSSNESSSHGNTYRGPNSIKVLDIQSSFHAFDNLPTNPVMLFFQVPLAEVRQNPKSGNLDVIVNISLQIKSNSTNGSSDTLAFHTLSKWYSDLLQLHKRCQLQFPFPNITTSRSENTDTFLVNEADRSNIEKYLSTIATSILNIDSKSQVSKEIIKFLDDSSNIIFDKIRMVQLESRLINTISYCERLEQRLVSTERNLNESTNIVSFLRYKVDQLENGNVSGPRPSHNSQSSNGPSHDPRYKQQPQSSSIASYSVLNGNNSSTVMDSVNISSLRLNDIGATYASESNINPSQLITLAESVLNEKGPLPVGEVGKMLQEATGNPQLSQILKERHNGLKKFLEKFSDKFIMSCDHPFNPHVYLRRSYSPDEQREIENGSTSYLDKKIKKSRRGKDRKQSWQAANVPPSSLQNRVYT